MAVWNCPRAYDYVRPISSVRYMCGKGQSSVAGGPSHHPEGITLEPGLVEVVTAASAAPGERHAHLAASVGKIAIHAWGGEPADPATQHAGAKWILGERWMPYVVRTTPDLVGFGDVMEAARALSDRGSLLVPAAAVPGPKHFLQVMRMTGE